MDPELGRVESFAVTAGLVTAVGTSEDIAEYIGSDTTTIDLAGRTVLPGFVDPHTHLLTDAGEPILVAQQTALANGITALGDASVEPDIVEQFLAVQDDLIIHVGMYLGRTTFCGEDAGTWYEEYPARQFYGDRLFVAGVKVFSDGGACGDLASSEPFIEGVPIAPPFHDFDTLLEMVRSASDAGYQLLIHAQGDLAVRDAQDAFEEVLDGAPNDLRHRIDHNSIVTPDLRARYSEIGILPVIWGTFYTCADIAWTDSWKTGIGENWRAMVDANPDLVIAWHGDDPSLPPISPLLDLASLVTRGEVAEDGSFCEPEPWLAATAITVEEALPMMTLNAAYALGLEDRIGSITPGKQADFLIVTDDPFEVAPRDLFDVQLMATFVDGHAEFCRPGDEALCASERTEGIGVSASLSRSGHAPPAVLDGVATGESFWSSGADAPQWLQITFDGPTAVDRVRFVVFQNPASETIHELEALVDGEWLLVETFAGFTETGDVLEWVADPEQPVSALRITTLESQSWPEWYEVEVDLAG